MKAGDAAECLGQRPWDYAKGDWADRYEWQTYGAIAKRRDHIGAGLHRLAEDGSIGAASEDLSKFHVGIWAVNMPEWQIVNLACAAYSLVNVSLYDTLGPDAIEYCVGHAECRVVFASPNHIPALLKIKREGKGVEKLKVIVSLVECVSSLGMEWTCALVVPVRALSSSALQAELTPLSFDDIDSRRPGIGKGAALREWAAQTGVKLMDFTERASALS